MRRHPGRLLSVVLACGLMTGCLFNVEHQLPPRAYFGKLPAGSGQREFPFKQEDRKNWYLAGWFAYSDWGVGDLVPPLERVERIEDLEIETRFSELDTLIWVVPGFVYGYYVWAPRTIRVSGTRVVATDPS